MLLPLRDRIPINALNKRIVSPAGSQAHNRTRSRGNSSVGTLLIIHVIHLIQGHIIHNWICKRDKYKKRTDPPKGSVLLYLKENVLGNDQLSQRASPQVPSALASLTTGFGMGPGVPLPLQSPRTIFTC